MHAGLRCLLLLGLAACGAPPAVVPPVPEAPEGPVDGDPRLGREVVPTAYALDLTLDPAQPRFTGLGEIEVTLTRPRRRIDLHAEGLDFSQVEAQVGAVARTGRAEAGPNGGLAVRFAEPLPAGRVVLRFRWSAPLPEVPQGLYRVKEGDDWYAFTQFEAVDARRAFPCFDQPEFKTPFQVTLRVPDGQVALGNAREIGRRTEGGVTIVNFARTRPLPTYLVAFAVGPFEVVEAPPEAIPGVPLRVVTTRGKGVLAPWALSQAPVIHRALEAWFGRPHGFDKLDLVAVPNFTAGAMENVGLVTFRETLLLLDAEAAPAQRKAWSLGLMAHELAHMWFGNLVTMAWWDDLWLNEAFATWMASAVVATTHPELEADLEALAQTRYVMSLDAQRHTRAVRQPVAVGSEAESAFDGITYGKGAALLRMAETWLGPAVFQQGVRHYIERHAGGSATTADLFAALGQAAGKDVAAVLAPFLDQPGVPLIQAALECPKDAKPFVNLAQSRYLPKGLAAPAGVWPVPVCLRYGHPAPSQECFLLTTPTARFELTTPTCPTWLHPNALQRGYYVWHLAEPEGLAALWAHRGHLGAAEAVALPGVLAALLEAGVLPAGAYLDGLELLAADEHRVVVEGVLDGLVEIDALAVDDGLRPAYGHLVRRLLRPHVRRLGAMPQPREPVADRLLRPRILNTLAYLGEDEALRAQARETVARFLEDPRSVSQEQVSQALPVAAWQGDEALWTQLRAAWAEAEGDPTTRAAVLRALASFEDPVLFTRTLDLLLDGTLAAQDFSTLVRGAGRSATRTAAWQWLVKHYDAVVAKLGPSAAPWLPLVGSGFCTVEEQTALATFFTEPGRAPAGTERTLAQVLERIDRCIRLRALVKAPLASWLAARGVPEPPPPDAPPLDEEEEEPKKGKGAKVKGKSGKGAGKGAAGKGAGKGAAGKGAGKGAAGKGAAGKGAAGKGAAGKGAAGKGAGKAGAKGGQQP